MCHPIGKSFQCIHSRGTDAAIPIKHARLAVRCVGPEYVKARGFPGPCAVAEQGMGLRRLIDYLLTIFVIAGFVVAVLARPRWAYPTTVIYWTFADKASYIWEREV